MRGVTKGLPALLRAHKVQNKAKKAGFDFEDIEYTFSMSLYVDDKLDDILNIIDKNSKKFDSVLKEIENKFSQKLGVNLLLKQQIVENAGIKLVVEDLGVEVSFSQEKFINDLRNHILKAF